MSAQALEDARSPVQPTGSSSQLQSVSELVTVSFSVGHLGDIAPETTPDDIRAGADARMYAHKRERRQTDG